MDVSSSEPGATAVVLAVAGVLMVASVVGSRLAERTQLPVMLALLALGMAAGSKALGGIAFADHAVAFRAGTIGLVLILFDGGLNTSWKASRGALAPALVLSTVGVAATAALVAVAARLCGFSWPAGWLLGAMLAPTDAAAVFAALRGSGAQLKKRVAMTLELEAGLNDPLAVVLTLALTGAQAGQHASGWLIAVEVVRELGIGLAGGLVVGFAARWLLLRLRAPAAGLLPVLTVAVAFAAFGGTTLCHGSGFLATYVAAVIVGNADVAYASGLRRVHDGLAWLAQVGVFLVLGLVSTPARLWAAAPVGLVIAGVLALLARPAATAVALLPFGFRAREVAFLGWTGLRGAVPIVLGILPILSGSPGAARLFDIVLVVVVVSAFVPGATVPWASRVLGIVSGEPAPPAATVEIVSARPLKSRVLSFHVAPTAAVAGAALADVPFPDGAAVMLVVRGDALVVARGDTVLTANDHVFVFCRPDAEDETLLKLLFGREDD